MATHQISLCIIQDVKYRSYVNLKRTKTFAAKKEA